MKISELKPNMLVQDRLHTVYKVSTVYARRVTLQVLLEDNEVPPRTTVRTMTPKNVLGLRPASVTMVNRMEDAWGLQPRNRGEEIILGAPLVGEQ